MISEKENTRISRFLSLVLRHQPETLGVTLDEQGWTDVKILIQKMNQQGFKLTREILDHVVETNNKKRFAYDEAGTKIRASQGHSVEVELGYEPVTPPPVLYHGTADTNVSTIRKSGLEKRSRHHVHLSADTETAIKVGQRHGKAVIFEVDAAKMNEEGFKFYVSENKVWLTDHVPPKYLRQIFL